MTMSAGLFSPRQSALRPKPPIKLSTFPTIETARLHLRDIVDADAPALFDVHGNSAHLKWFGTDRLVDVAGAQKLVERLGFQCKECSCGPQEHLNFGQLKGENFGICKLLASYRRLLD